MLYSKPIREISYQDVVTFCEGGHKEGSILEYKREFPSNNEIIAKIIAAFANTYGGLLIIGVNAPAGQPTPPFEGIVFDPTQKYEEKIQSIVLSHIREPVFPEVQICEPVNGKTFIVIRVSESHLTPHRVSNNTKIYVRTGQSSSPNDEAAWDKIEWLASRREKSINFRNILIEEANNYLRGACILRGINLDDTNLYFAVLTIGAVPLFPYVPFIPFRELANIETEIKVRYRDASTDFPERFFSPDYIQNGVRKLSLFYEDNEAPHGKPFEYTHLNTFGLYLWRRDIGEVKKEKGRDAAGKEYLKNVRWMNFWYFPIRLFQFLHSTSKFYQKLGYHGTLMLWVELSADLGIEIPHPVRRNIMGEVEEFLLVPRMNLRWERIVGVPKIREETESVVIDLTEDIGWSLNAKGLTEVRIKKSLENYQTHS